MHPRAAPGRRPLTHGETRARRTKQWAEATGGGIRSFARTLALTLPPQGPFGFLPRRVRCRGSYETCKRGGGGGGRGHGGGGEREPVWSPQLVSNKVPSLRPFVRSARPPDRPPVRPSVRSGPPCVGHRRHSPVRGNKQKSTPIWTNKKYTQSKYFIVGLAGSNLIVWLWLAVVVVCAFASVVAATFARERATTSTPPSTTTTTTPKGDSVLFCLCVCVFFSVSVWCLYLSHPSLLAFLGGHVHTHTITLTLLKRGARSR